MKNFIFPVVSGILVFGILSLRPINEGGKNQIQKKDTIPTKDTLEGVQGKKALFIGDSHTANNSFGWQKILCDQTGMIMSNYSVGGKTTSWMVDRSVYVVRKNYSYCFIYGGANDMYGRTKVKDAVENIQAIVKVCKGNGIKAIVLTGFDPEMCVSKNKLREKNNLAYISRYKKFQEMLLDSIKDATVIKTHFVSRKDGGCGDWLCHMTAKGHKKMAEGVIKGLKFKTIK